MMRTSGGQIFERRPRGKTALTGMAPVLLLAAWVCGMCRADPGPAAAGAREAELIAVLRSPAAVHEKADACRELARVGTAAAVPALAALLADEQLAHMARYGLEPIPGPAVDAALRAALGRLQGRLLAGVIDSLGVRRDKLATAALTALLKAPDPEVARSAAQALGRLGTPEAGQALQNALAGGTTAVPLAVYDGIFRCAEALAAQGERAPAMRLYDALRRQPQLPPQVQIGAWRGAILTRRRDGLPLLLEAVHSPDPVLAAAAARISAELPEARVTRALAQALGKMSADQQVRWAGVLGARHDDAALPALLDLSRAGALAARLAALQALVEIGGRPSVAALLALLNDPDSDIAQAAAGGLSGLPGPAVDAAIVQALGSRDRALKLKLIALAGQRRLAAALPVLLEALADRDETIRLAAIRSCEGLAGTAELPSLLERITKAATPGEADALEQVLGSIYARADDRQAAVPQLARALARARPAAQPALLRTLRLAGGPAALQAVRGALAAPSPEVQAAALRALCGWTTGAALPVLLDLAQTAAAPGDRLLALRGYLDLAARLDAPAPDKLARYQAAMPLIQRREEKQMLLSALAGTTAPAALPLIAGYLDDPAVKGEAVTAVMAVAEKQSGQAPDDVTRRVLEKVIQAAADHPAAVRRARELLEQMESGKQ